MKSILILTAAIVVILFLPFPAYSQTPAFAVTGRSTMVDPMGFPQGGHPNSLEAGPVGGVFPIAVNASTGYSQPAAVWANNLNTYFVAYRSSINEIKVTRVSPSGAINGNIIVASARDYYNRGAPRLAYNTTHKELLVVWEDVDPGTGYRNINGRVYNQNGTPISAFTTAICIGVTGAQCYHPAAAYSTVQDRYLVVWQRTSGPEASGDIESAFLTAAGDTEKFFPVRISGNNQSFAQPDVAFNHRRNEYLVVFQMTDCNPNPCNTDILGHRVNYLGDVLDGSFGIKIGYLTTQENHPAVAANPDPVEMKCWMVAWTSVFTPDPLDRDIYVNLLTCDGVPLGGNGWALVSTNLDDFNPAITFNEGIQQYLVAWTLTTNVPLNTSSIIGMEVNPNGNAADVPRFIGGWFGTQATVAAGPSGDFMVAYTESVAFGQQQVLGSLWGNRVYIPLVRK
jgi:hypothetical protein